jgi:hypothetical protein
MACTTMFFESAWLFRGYYTSRLFGAIDHERSDLIEEFPQERIRFGRERGFRQGIVHELNPAVARRPADGKRDVPHAQTGMPALFQIALRSSKPENQEIAQTFFGAREVVARVHRAQHFIPGYLTVEGGDETRESILTN